MDAKEKFSAVHALLLGLTAAFLAALTILTLRDSAVPAEGFRVDAQRSAAAETVPAEKPVSINTADAAELETLPGIGPALAEAIVEYRSAHGPFSSVDDLTEVPGVGEGKLRQLRDAVTLDEEDSP